MDVLEREILTGFQQMVEERLSVSRVILFGSRARGDSDPESHMDVLVVLDGPAGIEELEYVSDCAWEAGFGRGVVVTPVTVSRTEWEEGPLASSLLAIAVAKEGITV